MDISSEYLNPRALTLGRHIKALAAADVLDGYFFALDLKAGASKVDIEAAANRMLSDEENDADPESGRIRSSMAMEAYSSLMTSCWGTA